MRKVASGSRDVHEAGRLRRSSELPSHRSTPLLDVQGRARHPHCTASCSLALPRRSSTTSHAKEFSSSRPTSGERFSSLRVLNPPPARDAVAQHLPIFLLAQGLATPTRTRRGARLHARELHRGELDDKRYAHRALARDRSQRTRLCLARRPGRRAAARIRSHAARFAD